MDCSAASSHPPIVVKKMYGRGRTPLREKGKIRFRKTLKMETQGKGSLFIVISIFSLLSVPTLFRTRVDGGKPRSFASSLLQ